MRRWAEEWFSYPVKPTASDNTGRHRSDKQISLISFLKKKKKKNQRNLPSLKYEIVEVGWGYWAKRVELATWSEIRRYIGLLNQSSVWRGGRWSFILFKKRFSFSWDFLSPIGSGILVVERCTLLSPRSILVKCRDLRFASFSNYRRLYRLNFFSVLFLGGFSLFDSKCVLLRLPNVHYVLRESFQGDTGVFTHILFLSISCEFQ